MKRFVPQFAFRYSTTLILSLVALMALMLSGLSMASGVLNSPEASAVVAPFDSATCGTCSAGSVTCSGQLIGTGIATSTRIALDAVGNTVCGQGPSCGITPTGTFRYLSYVFTNDTGGASPDCFTVSLTTACTGTTGLASAAYLGSFNPTNVCTNLIADMGLSTNSVTTYQFDVANGQNFEIVVWNRVSGTFCTSPFTLTLTPCAGVPATTTATNVVFVQQPTDTVADQTITPAVTAQLQDNSSTNVSDPNIPITVVLTNGTGTLLGTATQLTDANGLATFSDLSINVVGSNKQLTASSGSLTPATSNFFNITQPAPVQCNTCLSGAISCAGQLIGHGTPTTARAAADAVVSTCANETCGGSTAGTFNYLSYTFRNSTALAQCYTVSFDNACNTASTSLFSAAYSPSFNPGNVCTNFLGDLGNGTQTTTTYQFTVPSGQNFEIVVWNRVSATYCTSPFTLTLTPCAALPPPTNATKVVFVQQPTDTVVDQSITPAVTVQLQDNSSTNITDANIPITVSLSNGSGVLVGTSTQMTDSNGLATFSGLSVNVVGDNKQLTASSGGLISAASSSFDITAAAAVACNTCASGAIACSGQLIGHGVPATSRAVADAVPSTCTNEPCAGSTAGTFNYLTYSFSNNSGASQCFTVTFDNACNTAAASLFSAAYSPFFDPNDVCANFVGDLGNGTNVTTSYQFTIGNGQSFDIVVWNRVSNSYCTSPFTLTLTPCPCPSITGSVSGGGTICSGGSSIVTVTLSGGAPPYTVTLDNGGGTLTGSSPLDFTVSPSVTTTYSVTSATDSSGCPANVSGSATVTVNQPPTTATAGGPQSICSGGTTAGLGGNTPTVGTGSWSIVSGGTGTFNPSAATPNATFTHTGGTGPIVVRWTISNSPCADSTANVTITIDQPPTTSSAGPDQSVCGSSATLAANAPSIGTGTWSVVSGTGSFTNINNPATTVTGLSAGANVLRWTITNGACAASTDNVTITSSGSSSTLTQLGDAKVWVGLKNSDDVGTKFDLLAEVLKNGVVIGSGQTNDLPGGSSGFNNAILDTITLALSSSQSFCTGDTLSFRLSVRVAASSGHVSGTARLWYNDVAANSRFSATVNGVSTTYFLRDLFVLATNSGPGKKTSDVVVNRNVGGNPFKPFGTWNITF
jgi:hypothetical protein